MSKKPDEAPEAPLFTVEAKQYVALVFPKSYWAGHGMADFAKTLSGDEARQLAVALKQASAELD